MWATTRQQQLFRREQGNFTITFVSQLRRKCCTWRRINTFFLHVSRGKHTHTHTNAHNSERCGISQVAEFLPTLVQKFPAGVRQAAAAAVTHTNTSFSQVVCLKQLQADALHYSAPCLCSSFRCSSCTEPLCFRLNQKLNAAVASLSGTENIFSFTSEKDKKQRQRKRHICFSKLQYLSCYRCNRAEVHFQDGLTSQPRQPKHAKTLQYQHCPQLCVEPVNRRRQPETRGSRLLLCSK